MAMLFFCALTYLKIYCRLPRHLNVNLTLESIKSASLRGGTLDLQAPC
jgi:hypothetical protein